MERDYSETRAQGYRMSIGKGSQHPSAEPWQSGHLTFKCGNNIKCRVQKFNIVIEIRKLTAHLPWHCFDIASPLFYLGFFSVSPCFHSRPNGICKWRLSWGILFTWSCQLGMSGRGGKSQVSATVSTSLRSAWPPTFGLCQYKLTCYASNELGNFQCVLQHKFKCFTSGKVSLFFRHFCPM